MLSFDLSVELRIALAKLSKKDRLRAAIVYKKIGQIASCDGKTIDHYKNLRHGLSDLKRVRIDKSFVLLFKVSKKDRHIIFTRLDRHDNIYKR